MSERLDLPKEYLDMRERRVNRTKTVVMDCVCCGKEVVLKVNPKDYEEYISPNRRHIQDIFPYLTPWEREIFISQLCEDCWADMFSFYEDEDDDITITGDEEDLMYVSPEDLDEWIKASCGDV